MMVAGRTGEDTSVGGWPVFLLSLCIHIAQDDTALRTGERLMRTACQPCCSFMQRVLELAARDESKYMGTIIEERYVLRLAESCDFGDGLREEKETLAHDDQLRRKLVDQFNRFLRINVVCILGQGQIVQMDRVRPTKLERLPPRLDA